MSGPKKPSYDLPYLSDVSKGGFVSPGITIQQEVQTTNVRALPISAACGCPDLWNRHNSLGKQEKLLPFARGNGAACKTSLPSEENFQFESKSGRIDSSSPYFPSQSEYILYIIFFFFLVISKGMILPDLFELSSIINTWLES